MKKGKDSDTVTCCVCKEKVEKNKAWSFSEYEQGYARRYFFCSENCAVVFLKERDELARSTENGGEKDEG
jgi:YHS domain-containing protein